MDVRLVFQPLNCLLCPTGLFLFGNKSSRSCASLQQVIFVSSHLLCLLAYVYTRDLDHLLDNLSSYFMIHVCGIVFIIVHSSKAQEMGKFVDEAADLLSQKQRKKLRRITLTLSLTCLFQSCMRMADLLYQAYNSKSVIDSTILGLDALTSINCWQYVSMSEFILFVLMIKETEKSFFGQADITDQTDSRSLCLQRMQRRGKQEQVNSLLGVVPILWFLHYFFVLTGYIMSTQADASRLHELLLTLPHPIMLLLCITTAQECVRTVTRLSHAMLQQLMKQGIRSECMSILERELDKTYKFTVCDMVPMDFRCILLLMATVTAYLTLMFSLQGSRNYLKLEKQIAIMEKNITVLLNR